MKKLLMILLACLFLTTGVFAQDFFKLVKSGTPEEVQAAIDGGASVNDLPNTSLSPLMVAAEYNQNAKVIMALLKAEATVNKKDKYGGMSPLMYAARNNSNSEVISVLLEAGANVNDIDDTFMSSLLHAAEHNSSPDVISRYC